MKEPRTSLVVALLLCLGCLIAWGPASQDVEAQAVFLTPDERGTELSGVGPNIAVGQGQQPYDYGTGVGHHAEASVGPEWQESQATPIPYSMPDGIDIYQVVRAEDGTFLFSCSNGRILWAQRDGPYGWTSNWVNSNRLDYAEDYRSGGRWVLVIADTQVWAHDSHRFILVWG